MRAGDKREKRGGGGVGKRGGGSKKIAWLRQRE